MTSWSYGVNPYPQWRNGVLYLREEPWWLALCGWVIGYLGYGCHFLHWIKMPNWLKVVREGHEYTWREYYGDLGQIYHVRIFDPLFQWHYGHLKSKIFRVEIGYDRVKEIFGERDAKFFANEESDLAVAEEAR